MSKTDPGRAGSQHRRDENIQLTPRPGTNGRTTGRDDRRIFRWLVAIGIAVLIGALIFNGVWWSDAPK